MPTTYHIVAAGGGDFTDITSAVTAAASGDTLLIYNGTYNETVNDTGKALEFLAAPADYADFATGTFPVVVDGTSKSGNLFTLGNGSRVAGLKAANAPTIGLMSSSTYKSWDVEDVWVANPGTYGVGNQDIGRTCKRVMVTGGSLQAIATTKAITIESCLVRAPGTDGIWAPAALVEHCTVDGALGSPSKYGIYASTVRNSIATNGASYGIRATVAYDNCCAYGQSVNFYSTPDAESIELDPLYTDRAGGDFSLLQTSPCVTLGAVAASALTDLYGVSFASPPSAGALQYVAPAPSNAINSSSNYRRIAAF